MTLPAVNTRVYIQHAQQQMEYNTRVYYVAYALCGVVAFMTVVLGIVAMQSTEFMDFESGLNARPSNVLRVDGEVLSNCQDYPACRKGQNWKKPYVYTSYFREWFLQPTDRFELWVTLLMVNPVVDVVESVMLFTRVPAWTSAAQQNSTAPPTAPNSNSDSSPRPVCSACVHMLAIGLAVRAVLAVASAAFFVARFDWAVEPCLPEDTKWELIGMRGRLWWLAAQQIACAVAWHLGMSVYQGNLLWSYCTASVASRWYGVALFFSFLPGIAIMPASEWLLLQSSCTVLGAANAQLFFLVPLVAGSVLACIVLATGVAFVASKLTLTRPVSPS